MIVIQTLVYTIVIGQIKEIHLYLLVLFFYTATNHITEVRPWGEYPCARRRSACALVGTEIVIFGGTRYVDTIKVQVENM